MCEQYRRADLAQQPKQRARYILKGGNWAKLGRSGDPRDLFKNLLISLRANRRDICVVKEWEKCSDECHCDGDCCCAFGATQELYFCIVTARERKRDCYPYLPLKNCISYPSFFTNSNFPPKKKWHETTFEKMSNKKTLSEIKPFTARKIF